MWWHLVVSLIFVETHYDAEMIALVKYAVEMLTKGRIVVERCSMVLVRGAEQHMDHFCEM